MSEPTSVPDGKGFKAWIKQSKPTEWLTAIAQFLGVIGLIVTGIYTLSIGLVEKKKSEIAAEVKNLQWDQKQLVAEKATVQAQIAANETKLKGTEERLAEASKKLETISQYHQVLAFLSELNKDSDWGKIKCKVGFDPTRGIFAASKVSIDYSPTMLRVSRGKGERNPMPKPIQSPDIARVLEAINTLASIAVVHHLEINSVQLTAKDLQLISELPGLAGLNLTNCGLDDTLIGNLRVSVLVLNLSHNPITTLPHADPSKVGMLLLSETSVSDETMSAFLERAIKCQMLDLDFTPVTDKTLDAIKHSPQEGQLSASLVRTQHTTDGVKRLLKRVKPEHLWVSGVETSRNEYQTYVNDNKIDTEIMLIADKGGGLIQRDNPPKK